MKYVLLFLLVGCSSAPVRNKHTDPVMRIFLSEDGLTPENYVRVQEALVSSGKYYVVDRGMAFRQAIQEQNMTRVNSPMRFDDPEKYSRLGKLYSVGGVVIGQSSCFQESSFFSMHIKCHLFLELVATSTGEVIATAGIDTTQPIPIFFSPTTQTADWTEAVQKLNDNFPEHYEQDLSSPELKQYKKVVAEEAVREKERTHDGEDLKEGLGR